LNQAYRASIRRRLGQQYPRYYRKLDKMQVAGQRPSICRLLTDLEETVAYQWERFFIAAIGRKGNKQNPGPLYNLAAGGEGYVSQDAVEHYQHGEKIARSLSKTWKTTGPRKGKRFRGVRQVGNSSFIGRVNVSSHVFSSPCVPTEEQAGRLYDLLALQHFGPDTYLNFPQHESDRCAT
jgi:hypothetical protein